MQKTLPLRQAEICHWQFILLDRIGTSASTSSCWQAKRNIILPCAESFFRNGPNNICRSSRHHDDDHDDDDGDHDKTKRQRRPIQRRSRCKNRGPCGPLQKCRPGKNTRWPHLIVFKRITKLRRPLNFSRPKHRKASRKKEETKGQFGYAQSKSSKNIRQISEELLAHRCTLC